VGGVWESGGGVKGEGGYLNVMKGVKVEGGVVVGVHHRGVGGLELPCGVGVDILEVACP
jgi:hypothetical protein